MPIPRRAFALFVVVATLLALAGCKAPSPVGKWSGSIAVPMLRTTLPATVEFTESGSMTYTGNTPLGPFNLAGTYTLDGQKILTNATTLSVGGRAYPTPKWMQNATGTWKIEGETLTLTRSGETQTLTRIKDETK